MLRTASLFSQILGLIPRDRFRELVQQHGTERNSKGFSSWTHFVSMLWCQLAQAKSLREIVYGLRASQGKLRHLGLDRPPPRSTLSYANKKRPYELFESAFHSLYDELRTSFGPNRKFRFKNKLYSIDGSVIDLCASTFDWAKYKRTKGGVKLHLVLDHDGYLPAFGVITGANSSEIKVAASLKLQSGAIVTVDRGYLSFDLFRDWTKEGVFFVTRPRSNIEFETVEDREVPAGSEVRRDRIVRVASRYLKKKDCPDFRLVTIWDESRQREFEFLTNNFRLAATTIGRIYKDRWEIESFFRTLKQTLRVKTFVGTSANALKCQIWAALIAILLLKYMKERSKTGWSLSNLVAVLHLHLLTYKELWPWLASNGEAPDPRPPPARVQQLLALSV